MPGAPDAGSCLLRSIGGGHAAVGAAAQWQSMLHFSACCARLQPNDICTRNQFVQSTVAAYLKLQIPGARMQIRIAMQEPARIIGQESLAAESGARESIIFHRELSFTEYH